METEGSISSLTYKGSISDAIAEAKKQKKLFLVHISGEDENSSLLKQSTWADQAVAESISKYCIFLLLIQGGIEALQFSAIYQQESFPSITAVGYNGVMLWQHGGYISAENFVGAIEKAWASLHFQGTAATLLSTALSSTKREHSKSSSQVVSQVNSSASDGAFTSADEQVSCLEDRASVDSELTVDQMDNGRLDDKETIPGLETSSQSDQVGDVTTQGGEETISTCMTSKDVLLPVSADVHISTSVSNDAYMSSKGGHTVDGSRIVTSSLLHERENVSGPGSVQETPAEVEKSKTEDVGGPTGGSNVIKLNHIHLNIRLPTGASLQKKFTPTDTLRSVKDYVDENQISGIDPYDLAVPYPRKIFDEQDMNTVLSELGFAGRQALIVVPRPHTSGPQRRLSSRDDSRKSTRNVKLNDDNNGYFGVVRRAFSYLNPFSYLPATASSSDSEPASSGSGSVARRSKPYGPGDENPSGSDDAGGIRRTSRPLGCNIHTLQRDEDDLPSADRNTFWNGNSTEFGGDDRK